MVDMKIEDGNLIIDVEGIDKFFSLKSKLTIPLEHVSGARADPEIAKSWLDGIKEMGSDIPGIIKAGTFYENHGQIFWDVHHPENAVVIELKDERYRELIVEVKDPQSSVNEILNAIG